ncbi:MAG: 4Fe-4S dicluster domain-containing protein [Actinomycetota bacterium]|nr:4Fe-4S dicluster domain-containing protein [Actinomycetota bacterium]
MVSVNPDFKKNLSEVEKAGEIDHCYQCNACVSECPTARLDSRFNPAEIVLSASLGLGELIDKDSIIWECATCYKCYEFCPQGTHPVEVITALKNVAYKSGNSPEEIKDSRVHVIENGTFIPLSEAIKKRRRELGLPEVDSTVAEQVKKIME